MIAAGRGHQLKQLTVAEDFLHFTGKELISGHRSRADAEACAHVYFALLAREAGA